MSCDFDHAAPAETCACWCACDAVVHFMEPTGTCMDCSAGIHEAHDYDDPNYEMEYDDGC